jgi:hypothetical protein
VVLTLNGQRYEVHEAFERGAQLTSPLLSGLAIDVAAILDAD